MLYLDEHGEAPPRSGCPKILVRVYSLVKDAHDE